MNNEMYNTGPYAPPGSPLYYEGMPTPNQQTAPNVTAMPSSDPEYIEGVLKAVEPMPINAYMTFNGSVEWLDKKFTGILEASGKDYILISDPKNGHWTLLPNIYIDYLEFDESIAKYIRK